MLPISCLPEPEALHVLAIVTHWGIAIRRSVQVEVNQLLEICTHDLVRVDKDDVIEVHREEHIKEENLVCPDKPLFYTFVVVATSATCT
jgi:hypothetical protein